MSSVNKIQKEAARNIVREYNKFKHISRVKYEEAIKEIERATMFSLKQILKLADGDAIEIYENDTFYVKPIRGIKNAR